MSNATAPRAVSMRVKLADIVLNPRNPNRMSAEVLEKVRTNILRTGMMPPVILRPDKKGVLKPPFHMIDGEHRYIIAKEAEWPEVDASIWDVTERESMVALAALNRLHGEDDLKRRADLVQELSQVIPIDQLTMMLPESPPEIEDLLRITQVDLEALVVQQTEAAQRNDDETAKPFTVLLYPKQLAVVALALDHIKSQLGEGNKNPDGNALEMMAADYLAGAGLAATPSDEIPGPPE
jgi:ParB-like nuclease domain